MMKKLIVAVGLLTITACSGGGAPQGLYDEYHEIICKLGNGSLKPADLTRQLELNTEFEKYEADSDHAKKLAEALDTSTCN